MASAAWLALAVSCSDEPAKPAQPSEARAPVIATLHQELLSAYETPDAQVPVIVHFHTLLMRGSGEARATAIAAAQQSLTSTPIEGFTVTRRFKHVPAISGMATKQALERLASDPNVASIELDAQGNGHLKEAVPAIGGDRVKTQLGLTGRGVRVAVLDTGIVSKHPDLRSSVVAQHCFTQRACPPRRTAEGTSAEDDHGHGTNVSGIVASDGVVAPAGFAPDAEIVAVKVNDSRNAGMESDWVAGLDWIYDNLSTLKVKVVNLSLGTTAMHADTATCDRRHPAMASAIKNLIDAGVTVFAASGNSGVTNALPAPACISGTIVVGATYDKNVGAQPPGAATYNARWGGMFARCGDRTTALDRVACITNSTRKVDIVAPGAPMTSSSLRNGVETYWGTSQAAPVASAVAALMLQCNPQLKPAEIKQAMVRTGVRVTDPKNGLIFPSLRAFDAVRAACPNAGVRLLGEPGENGEPAPGVTPPDVTTSAAEDGLAPADSTDEGDEATGEPEGGGDGSPEDGPAAADATRDLESGCALVDARQPGSLGVLALLWAATTLGRRVRRRRDRAA